MAEATVSNPARPAMGAGKCTMALDFACVALMQDSTAAGIPWCIRSVTPTENYVPITNGFIDNAFDTVRRRGPKTTTRQVWGSPT
jgi:hypothetical protein